VVFNPPTESSIPYVKRVVAVGGETVDLRDGRLYVDDRLLVIPQANGNTLPQVPRVSYPFTVPDGEVFVLGDNRLQSSDSRTFGSVPVTNIIGKVILRFWPLDRLVFFEW
jgi:signal peptidase I